MIIRSSSSNLLKDLVVLLQVKKRRIKKEKKKQMWNSLVASLPLPLVSFASPTCSNIPERRWWQGRVSNWTRSQRPEGAVGHCCHRVDAGHGASTFTSLCHSSMPPFLLKGGSGMTSVVTGGGALQCVDRALWCCGGVVMLVICVVQIMVLD